MDDYALVHMKYPICAEPWVIYRYTASKEARECIRFETWEQAKAHMFDLLHETDNG